MCVVWLLLVRTRYIICGAPCSNMRNFKKANSREFNQAQSLAGLYKVLMLTLLQTGLANSMCAHVPLAFQSDTPSSPHFPVTSAINSASPGLQSKSQRRGVIPFVLFWNLSGSSSLKSLNLEKEETHRWIWLKWQIPACRLTFRVTIKKPHVGLERLNKSGGRGWQQLQLSF